jgi:hypothetical protein
MYCSFGNFFKHSLTNIFQNEFHSAISLNMSRTIFHIHTELNVTNFKTTLYIFYWTVVINDNNPETANNFCHGTFSELHDVFFQPKQIKLNRNIHKRDDKGEAYLQT